ncbi:PEP-CTERM sorting domain-containing protein [Prosthecobacter sp.]|uniref:PEP-CTERM sorting domain-containing protein n=1 Tax=Prosthecobacter sp. TaxID=1965333 RepID=UPI0037831C59
MKTLSDNRSPGRQPLASLVAALLLAAPALSSASTIELSQPYTPAGQNYSITALQGMNPLTLQGAMAMGANPNVNLDFQGGFGVRYTNSSGSLVDFGVGLYYDAGCNSGLQLSSTGLNVQFNQTISSQGLSLTIGHLGISDLSTDFSTGTVAPTIGVYGPGGFTEFFSAHDILASHALTLLTSNDPIAQTDLWKLDVHALVGDTLVNNVTLGADIHNGSGATMTVPSDPYFLVAANGGNCAMIPEPGSAFLILSAGLGCMIITRRRNRSLISAR